MSYTVCRMAKRKAWVGIAKSSDHNQRENENYSNNEINLENTKENYSVIDEDFKKPIQDKVLERIEEGYTKKSKIRKDAVIGAEFVLTSDQELFSKLSKEQEKRYFELSTEFLKEKFGEKNVVSAIVHKDETTPHLHAYVVPLTQDGRLSMKDFVNGKKDLSKLQDDYYKKMVREFEVERGQKKEITNKQHIPIPVLKSQTLKEVDELQKRIEYLTERQKTLKNEIRALKNENDVLKKEIVNQTKAKEVINVVKNSKKMFSKNYEIQPEHLELLEKSIINSPSLENTDLKKIINKKNEEIKELSSAKSHWEKENTTLHNRLGEFHELKKNMKAIGLTPERVQELAKIKKNEKKLER